MKKFNNLYTDIYGFFILKKNFNKNRVKKIFSLIRVDNTFKTTNPNRMFDVNIILKNYIKKFFSNKINICDLGISSGQSTLELYKELKEKNINYLYGFDKQIFIKIFKFKNLVFLYSLDNNLLMVEYKKYCLRYRYFIFFKQVEKILIYLFKIMKINYYKTDVLVPGLHKINNFKFCEQDIFNMEKKYFNYFDVVRVTNLLNYSYFSRQKIKIAKFYLNKISKENSIILINRTNDKKKNIASIFRKRNGKFELLEDINGGSEIKDIMLSL